MSQRNLKRGTILHISAANRDRQSVGLEDLLAACEPSPPLSFLTAPTTDQHATHVGTNQAATWYLHEASPNWTDCVRPPAPHKKSVSPCSVLGHLGALCILTSPVLVYKSERLAIHPLFWYNKLDMKLNTVTFILSTTFATLVLTQGAEDPGPSPTASVGCEPHGDHW